MSPATTIRRHDLPDQEDVLRALADQILQIADRSITARGIFRLALTGGRSAEKLYQQLQQSTDNFDHWEFWFGDERNIPEGHSERNSLMASHLLFNNQPPNGFHPIPYMESAIDSASHYQTKLQDRNTLPFDLVLLSLGEDGHIASLFPDHPYDTQAMVIAVEDAPKDPPSRISLTATTLSNCRNMIIMATGADKQEALSAWFAGENLPVATLNPECGIDLWTTGSGLHV